jgi:hypothetical protein
MVLLEASIAEWGILSPPEEGWGEEMGKLPPVDLWPLALD